MNISILFLGVATTCCILPQVVAAAEKLCYTIVDPCPTSWHHWGSSCYRVTETTFPWARARQECENLGGILAVPRSLQESDLVLTLIPVDKNAWIDCSSLETDGAVVCKEGNDEVAFRNWDAGQPGTGEGEDCVLISRQHGSQRKWHDYFCGFGEFAVCKQPATRKIALV